MRKLKLQMQVSVDGFVAGPNGEMDWMVWNWDEALVNYVHKLTEPVDGILLGRKLAEGFIDIWTARLNDPQTADDFARKMVDTPKVIFSKTLESVSWENTRLAKGNLADEVRELKNQPGKDLIAYGGGSFISNLIETGLIDEYHFFINPTALGSGMAIFKDRTKLKLTHSQLFDCGVLALQYEPGPMSQTDAGTRASDS